MPGQIAADRVGQTLGNHGESSANIAQRQICGMGQIGISALVYRETPRGNQVRRLLVNRRECGARTVLAQRRRGELLMTRRGGSATPTLYASHYSGNIRPGAAVDAGGGRDNLKLEGTEQRNTCRNNKLN